MMATRITVSDTQVNTILLPEVNGKCPLCGKFPLSENKNGKLFKKYEVAHIYPHSPTSEQKRVLANVQRVSNIESLENLIVLCKECHRKQDFHTSVSDYIKLYNIKQRLRNNAISKENLGKQNIEEAILGIIYSLKKLTSDDLKNIKLKMNPVKVDEKIKNNFLLSDSIKEKVIKYFSFIQEQFSILEQIKGNKFDLIASQIKTAYIQAKISGLSEEDVFNQLVGWLENLTTDENNKTSCEIIISFFVQDCEVFE